MVSIALILVIAYMCSVTLSLVNTLVGSQPCSQLTTLSTWDMCEFKCRFHTRTGVTFVLATHCLVSSKVSCLYGYCTSQSGGTHTHCMPWNCWHRIFSSTGCAFYYYFHNFLSFDYLFCVIHQSHQFCNMNVQELTCISSFIPVCIVCLIS